jgi:hypothetical protein
MSSRKETPDILGDILGGVRSYPSPSDYPADYPGPPEAASAPAKPLEWEYREVVFRDYRGWRARMVNGRELGDWRSSPTIVEYLEQAGAEGWELVSMSDRHNNQKEAYFKRPKQ